MSGMEQTSSRLDLVSIDGKKYAPLAVPLRVAAQLVGCHVDTMRRALVDGEVDGYYAVGPPVEQRTKRYHGPTRIMLICDSLMRYIRERRYQPKSCRAKATRQGMPIRFFGFSPSKCIGREMFAP